MSVARCKDNWPAERRSGTGDTGRSFRPPDERARAGTSAWSARVFSTRAASMDKEKPFSTAADIARLTRYAMNNAGFRFYVSQKEREIEFGRGSGRLRYLLRNTNELLGRDEIDGVKTGRTARAGDCLVLSATRPSEVVQEGATTSSHSAASDRGGAREQRPLRRRRGTAHPRLVALRPLGGGRTTARSEGNARRP